MDSKNNINTNQQQETLTSKETFVAIYKFALDRSKSPLLKTFLMGLAAGLFIGIGYIAAIYATRGLVGDNGLKNVLFGVVFTVAIMMIIFVGGELFTTNSMMCLPVIRRQVKVSTMLLNLLVVLLGNFLGCAILALLTWWSGFLDNKEFLANAKTVIDGKMVLPWWKMFFSGLLCNFLVAGSVYAMTGTRSSAAKFLILFLIIFVFALSGFSHIVANAYPWALMPILNIYDVPYNFNDFLQFGYQTQLPTLFGNFISGGIILPGLYCLIFRKELPKTIIEM